MGLAHSKDHNKSKLNLKKISKDGEIADNSVNININDITILNKKLYDVRYGDVKLIKDNNTNKCYIVKDIIVNNKEALKNEINSIYAYQTISHHPNIINILGYLKNKGSYYCSSYYELSIFIDYYQKDLLSDLNDHIKDGLYYHDIDLLYIIYNLIYALYTLQTQNIIHGDIRPINVFVDNDTGLYKIIHPQLNLNKSRILPRHHLKHDDDDLLELDKHYFSPQIIDSKSHANCTTTGNGNNNSASKYLSKNSNPYKDDVYSLGITLLSCATLTRGEDLYDYNRQTIFYTLLAERLNIVREKYNNGLIYSLINSMVMTREKERPDFIELYDMLKPYEEDIKNKTKITIQNTSPSHDDTINSTPQKNQLSESFKKYEIPLNIEPLVGEFDISAYSYDERILPVVKQSLKPEVSNLNVHSYSPDRVKSSIFNTRQEKAHTDGKPTKSIFAHEYSLTQSKYNDENLNFHIPKDSLGSSQGQDYNPKNNLYTVFALEKESPDVKNPSKNIEYKSSFGAPSQEMEHKVSFCGPSHNIEHKISFQPQGMDSSKAIDHMLISVIDIHPVQSSTESKQFKTGMLTEPSVQQIMKTEEDQSGKPAEPIIQLSQYRTSDYVYSSSFPANNEEIMNSDAQLVVIPGTQSIGTPGTQIVETPIIQATGTSKIEPTSGFGTQPSVVIPEVKPAALSTEFQPTVNTATKQPAIIIDAKSSNTSDKNNLQGSLQSANQKKDVNEFKNLANQKVEDSITSSNPETKAKPIKLQQLNLQINPIPLNNPSNQIVSDYPLNSNSYGGGNTPDDNTIRSRVIQHYVPALDSTESKNELFTSKMKGFYWDDYNRRGYNYNNSEDISSTIPITHNTTPLQNQNFNANDIVPQSTNIPNNNNNYSKPYNPPDYHFQYNSNTTYSYNYSSYPSYSVPKNNEVYHTGNIIANNDTENQEKSSSIVIERERVY